MQDRVSLYPGRVKLVPVAGQENTYDMVRADSPTQEGTPLNKGSLLKDATAALYGLGADAVPDDALALLKTIVDKHDIAIANGVKIATGSYTGTGKYGERNPNILTFNFIPKYIAIYYIGPDHESTPIKTELTQGMYGVFNKHSIFSVSYYDADNENTGVISAWGTTVKFYSDYNRQPNKQGDPYKYLAIG